MSKWERLVGAVGAVLTVAGAVLGLFGVSTFGLLEPFAMFLAGTGLFCGGLAIGWYARDAVQQRSTGVLRRRYGSLDGRRRQLLEDVYMNGMTETYWESDENAMYEGMSAMGFIEGVGGGLYFRWKLTDKCRRMMDEMKGI